MRMFRISAYDTLGYLAAGYAFLFLLDWSLGDPLLGGRLMLAPHPSLGGAVFVGILSYVAGHLVGHAAHYFIEELIVRKGYVSRDIDQKSETHPLTWGKTSDLSDETQARVEKRVKEENLDETASDVFQQFDVIVKRNETVADRLAAFLVLYGFCRNMALVLVVSGVAFLGGDLLEMRKTGFRFEIDLFALPVCWISGYFMYKRYRKFNNLYESTVLRNFAEKDEPKGKSSE